MAEAAGDTLKATSRFDVTGWDETPYGDEGDGPHHSEGDGPHLSEALVVKEYHGDLEGAGRARVLMCRASRDGPLQDAGYIASERVVGRLGSREGSFVLQHWGVAAAGSPPRTDGHVVPGSGTGELAGLSGSMEIVVDADGRHTIELEYRIDP